MPDVAVDLPQGDAGLALVAASLSGCGGSGQALASTPGTSSSSSPMKDATPDFVACVMAPPSSSTLTSCPVTVFTTSGPVMNMYELPSTISTKSVIAGE